MLGLPLRPHFPAETGLRPLLHFPSSRADTDGECYDSRPDPEGYIFPRKPGSVPFSIFLPHGLTPMANATTLDLTPKDIDLTPKDSLDLTPKDSLASRITGLCSWVTPQAALVAERGSTGYTC
jgi:hypothetical protein